MKNILLMGVLLCLVACSSVKVRDSWTAPQAQPIQAALVVVVLMDDEVRRKRAEQVIAEQLSKAGLEARAAGNISGLSGKLSRDKALPILRAEQIPYALVTLLAEVPKVAGYATPDPDEVFLQDVMDPTGEALGQNSAGSFSGQYLELVLEVDLFKVSDLAKQGEPQPLWRLTLDSKDPSAHNIAEPMAKLISRELKNSGLMQ